MHLLGVLHAWEERGGRVCPAQVRVFSFVVFSLVWRPPVACGAPALCVKVVLGSLPGERGGVKGPQGPFHLFFVLALALGGREGDSCEGLCERRVSSAVEQSAPVRSVVSSNPARVSWLS